jgi:hypothetical protein
MKMKRRPTYFTDHNGKRCVRVHLANTPLFAELYADKYHDLIALGVPGDWFSSRGAKGIGYPAVTVPGFGTQFISRLIAELDAGKQVSYGDRNRLNLRQENIHVVDCRHARQSTKAVMEHLRAQSSGCANAA